jgi:hypothetical protein
MGFNFEMGGKVLTIIGTESRSSVQLDSGERVGLDTVFMNLCSASNLELARNIPHGVRHRRKT